MQIKSNYQRLVTAVFDQAIEDIKEEGWVNTDRDLKRYKRESYYFWHSKWAEDLKEFVGVDRKAIPEVVQNTAASQFNGSPSVRLSI